MRRATRTQGSLPEWEVVCGLGSRRFEGVTAAFAVDVVSQTDGGEMKTIEYRTVDKSPWPRGAWDMEPDKKQWQDEATGLPCLIVRNRGGALCGYVGVPEGHPLFEKDYGSADVRVHGGLTFADHCTKDESQHICHKPDEGEPDNVWWLGFDCSHSGDVSPARERFWGGMSSFGESYRDIHYVESECRDLARQLAAITKAEEWAK